MELLSNYDHPGECNPLKDCLRSQSERKSSSESSKLWNVSRWCKYLWLLTRLVSEVEMLLVTRLSVSCDVVGCTLCKK